MKVLIPLLLLLVSCNKEHKVIYTKKLEAFTCKATKAPCISSQDQGKEFSPAFKLMEKSLLDNLRALSKIAKSLELKSQFEPTGYFRADSANASFELILSKDKKEFLVRSQARYTAPFSDSGHKDLTEKIRFKYYQRDY